MLLVSQIFKVGPQRALNFRLDVGPSQIQLLLQGCTETIVLVIADWLSIAGVISKYKPKNPQP